MFALRVDIDSSFGLVNGVPNILRILEKTGLKASFYCVTGGETGIIDVLTNKNSIKEKYSLAGVKLPKLEMARVALLPHNFALKNAVLLRKIKQAGHEVGCHGWKHREWTRNLESLDLQDRFKKIQSVYEQIFSEKPKSFACPGFNWNKNVLKALNEFGYACSGDLEGNEAFAPVVDGEKLKCVQVPVNCKAENTMPLTEYYHYQGASDEEVAEKTVDFIFKKHDEFGYAVFYCHDLFEGVYKPLVLERILTRVLEGGIKTTTVEDIALNCRKTRVV